MVKIFQKNSCSKYHNMHTIQKPLLNSFKMSCFVINYEGFPRKKCFNPNQSLRKKILYYIETYFVGWILKSVKVKLNYNQASNKN